MLTTAKTFFARNWLLLLILLFALTLRLIYYMGVVRGDDYTYANYAYQLSKGGFDQSLLELVQTAPLAGIDRPGLYGPVAIFFQIFGQSEFVATLFPLLGSLVTIIFIYKIALLLNDRKAAHVAVFLWAVFPLDIFMATQLDPEGLLAMTSSGVILCLLLAYSTPRRNLRLFYYLLGIFFALWALLIKQSVTPIIFVVIVLLAVRFWPAIISRGKHYLASAPKGRANFLLASGVIFFLAGIVFLANQPWPSTINRLELTAYDIAPTWVLGRQNPVQMADLDGGYWTTSGRIFTPPAQAEPLKQAIGGERFKLFDAYFPIFLISAAYAVIQHRKSFYVPLIWFSVLFFYLEWGSFPRTFSLAGLFTHLPITHWIAPDNFLYLCVPMVLVISFYISAGLKERFVGMAIVAGIALVLAFALFLETTQYQEVTLSYVKLCLALVLTCAMISPFVLKNLKTSRGWITPFVFLVPFIGIASLLPSSHYHVWDFHKEQDRRENLLKVNSYLMDQPKLPIYAGSGPTGWLDLYSGFKYGFDFMNEGYGFPETRMTDDLNMIEQMGGYFLSEGCVRPISDLGSWPIAEFGDSATTECISLVRHLPPDQAREELSKAKQAYLNLESEEALNTYLIAAANAEDFGQFVNALSLIVTYFPENTPIVQASGILEAYSHRLSDSERKDILLTYSGEGKGSWEFALQLTPSLIEENNEDALMVKIKGITKDTQSIYLTVNLKPKTAYILEIDLRATAPFDLVRFPNQDIPDSYLNSWNRDLNWTDYQIVFVTPNWTSDQNDVLMELARVYDSGRIWFRTVNIIELRADD